METIPLSTPPQQRRSWIALYTGLWLISFIVFCAVYGAVQSLHFSPARLGIFGALLLYAASGVLPWVASFVVGLIISGGSLLFTTLTLRRHVIFWKRALIIAWLPALFILYSGWNAQRWDAKGEAPTSDLRTREGATSSQGVADAVDRYTQRALTSQMQYQSDVERIAGLAMLSADTLASEAGIAQNRRRLAELRQRVDQEATLSRADALHLKDEIAKLVADSSGGQESLKSIESFSKEREDLNNLLFANQQRLFNVMSNLNDFMGSQNGRVVSVGGQVRFETIEDDQKYNSFVQELKELAKDEASLLARFHQLNKRSAR
jgi:hypothetical protein